MMKVEPSQKRLKAKIHISDNCKGCGFCIEFCPTKAIKRSDKFNSKGYHPPIVDKEELCTGCDFCTMVCPDFSIWVTKITS